MRKTEAHLVTSVEVLREVRHAVKTKLFYLRRRERTLTRDYQLFSNLQAQQRLVLFLKQIEQQVGDIKFRSED